MGFLNSGKTLPGKFSPLASRQGSEPEKFGTEVSVLLLKPSQNLISITPRDATRGPH